MPYRDVSQIKINLQDAMQKVDSLMEDLDNLKTELKETWQIAEDIDARTSSKDPSVKEKGDAS